MMNMISALLLRKEMESVEALHLHDTQIYFHRLRESDFIKKPSQSSMQQSIESIVCGDEPYLKMIILMMPIDRTIV
jgi:hypothetical protein